MGTRILALMLCIAISAVSKAETITRTSSTDTLSNRVCVAFSRNSTCEQISPVQPDDSDLAFIGRIYDTGKDDFTFSMYGNSQKTILIDGVPFSQYWQLKDPNQYVFHPMVWGRYIFENADNSEFRSSLETSLDRTSLLLPNDGLAFYYPNHYPLNRMRGPDVMYSAISQSELLAGFLRLESITQTLEHKNYSKMVLNGLMFSYVHGGVNLDSIALLEFPMYRSNPEIILNGWLHALLHLNDWAIYKQDIDVSKLVENNLNFLLITMMLGMTAIGVFLGTPTLHL